MRRGILWLAGALALGACDDESSPAGPCGASPCDAAPAVDARVDADRPDASEADQGAPDAEADAAPADAEVPEDAASPDAAEPEPDAEVDAAPELDAEPEPDAAEPEPDAEVDAAPEPDAGVDAELEPDAEVDAAVEPDAEVNPCPEGQLPEAERCNAFDDDCDGVIDEGFEVGGPCAAEGRCGPGVVECDPADDEGTVCSTGPGGSADQSVAERCNGRDDDCDGATDEAPELLAVACYTGPAETREVGECRDGSRACADGRLQACAGDVRPSRERCDGADEDCDGEIDEGYVAVEICGQGVCRATAEPSACVGGVERPCQPGPAQGDDANCDGLDDDCDGRIDEGFVPEGNCGVGRCGAEALPSRCREGQVLPCQPAQPAPLDLLCDGSDDDCDGQTDEDYSATAQCGLGICRTTSTGSRCVDGVETACQPGAPTGDDANCDGVDDDCDGRVDEAYAVVAECGVGACAEAPTPSRCVNGVEFACQPGVRALADATCDGRDDDCDGQADEDYVVVRRCGQGVCAGGATPSQCVDGVETACVPGPPAAAQDDSCNRLDDDCDGVVDDDVPDFSAASVRITAHQGGAIEPRIAANPAGGFGLVWADNRPDARGIYFARVDAAGAPVGDQVRVAALPGLIRKPDVVAYPEGYAIVFHTTAVGPAQVYFARVDFAGNVVQAPTRLLETGTDASDARVTWNGAEFAVVWTDARHAESEIYLRRLTAAGLPIGAAVRVSDVAGPATVPGVAPLAVGQGYMTVYNENVGGAFSVWAQRISVNGRPLGNRFEISDDRGNSNAPVIVPSAQGGFAVAWYDTRDDNTEIYAAHITNQGVRDGNLERISDDLRASTLAAITPADAGFAVTWMDTRTGNTEVWVRRAGAALVAAGAARQVSDDPSTSFSPAIAFDGTHFGLTWYDGRHGEPEVYFRLGRLGCAP